MFELTDKNFHEEVLKADLPVLVDFWAPWCQPCLMAGPVIEELAEEYQGKMKVGKVNVDENPGISQKYGIMSIPTVIIFKKGKEIKRLIGFPGKSGYQGLIEEAIKLT
jgi:thioredoxin 1